MRRARSNLALATRAPGTSEVLYDDLCFEAHQAAEKAVKAILVARQRDFRKTHDIGELLDLVVAEGLTVPADVGEARRLTPYAVGGRYPRFGEDVSTDEWREAVTVAERVVQWAGSIVASSFSVED
jgi:HEPN domain-containing protein